MAKKKWTPHFFIILGICSGYVTLLCNTIIANTQQAQAYQQMAEEDEKRRPIGFRVD